MKILVLVLGLLGAAGVATLVRYGSLHPCDWLNRDAASVSGLPDMLARARVHADFLLKGITEPTPGDCLTAWWDLKAEDAAAAREQ